MTNTSLGQGREARVSVNLDIANLPAEAAATILKEAVNYGRVVTARAFSDFRRNDLGDLPVQLFQLGFQLIHCPSWPNGGGRLKSVVDSILAQDLRDQSENDPSLDVFILGSGDRDFLAVVHALRRHGRKVIIASTADASNRSLLATADGFIQIQAPERHSFNIPSAQMYAPQPPAAVYTGPVTSLPYIAPSPAAIAAPVAAPTPAPVRHAAPHLLPPRQRHNERGIRNVVAPAAAPPQPRPVAAVPPPPVAAAAPPAPAAAPPVASAPPPAVHPLQPQRQPFGRTARSVPAQPEREPEVAVVPAAAPAPAVVYPHLTAATLHEQIMGLVFSQPQITPRQVLQALAPRAEAGSARRRQAIGDAIAQLIQQGRLERRTEVVRGRPAEVLLVSGDGTAEVEAAPLEPPFVAEMDEEAVAPPAPARREAGRSRFGERRTGRAAPPPAFREPLAEADLDLPLDFAATDVEPVVDVPSVYLEDVLDGPMVWEPVAAPAVTPAAEAVVTAAPEAGPAFEPQTERAAPERSTLVGRRAAPAPRQAAAAVEQPVRPASRFRAPVFTHTPEVVEAAPPAPEQTAPAAVTQQQSGPEAASVAAAAEPAPVAVTTEAAAPAQEQQEAPAASETAEGAAAEDAVEEAAATAAPRPRRRRTRARSATGKGEATGAGEESAVEGESAAAAQ